MPAPESLKEVYADEMKDLWSANDQMTRAVTTMAGKAHDPKLKQTLGVRSPASRSIPTP